MQISNMNHPIMIFTIFSALAGILIFAIWSSNNFYVYAQQSYSPSRAAAPSKPTNSTGNHSNATTIDNTPIGQQQQQQQTTSMSSSSSVPSIQSQQSPQIGRASCRERV